MEARDGLSRLSSSLRRHAMAQWTFERVRAVYKRKGKITSLNSATYAGRNRNWMAEIGSHKFPLYITL